MALNEAGARHSASDMAHLDNIHNAAVALGASCAPVGEAAKPGEVAESALTDVNLGRIVQLREGAVSAAGSALMKIISPGWGSSGYYSPELLARDLPKIYPAGTKNFWNHQTPAEEAARPEGDLRDLASVFAEGAYYDPAGPDGPGGYAKVEVVEQYRSPINQLAKHIGASIRAAGQVKEGVAPDGKKGPIVEKLTRGLSVDYVTTPGAGGKILQLFEAARDNKFAETLRLTESARAEIPTQEADAKMAEATEVQKLQEALTLQSATIKRQAQRIARSEAREAATAKLATIRFTPEQRLAIVTRCVEAAPITADLDLDTAAFTAVMEREIKFAADLIPGGIKVVGQGDTGTQAATPEQIAEAKRQDDAGIDRFAAAMGFGGAEHKVGRDILAEGYRAFEPTYNARTLKEARQ